MSYVTKTSKCVAAFQAKDFKEALKIAKDFKCGVTREEAGIIRRGYECMVNPDFYRQLGKDIEACISEAQVVLFQRIIQPATKEKSNG